ncbi:MAG TPA: fumarylacetoacetate hydrolase family protein [Tepidisphaeraceae bacterium]|nr:fumarylacetoacetate hydrolase family protein [Tepidisphaeraceae bacterium]
MRLATVFDLDANEPRPIFELPGGQRVALRELFRSEGADIDRLPIFFSDIACAVQHLDDVVDAARDWARSRADLTGDARSLPSRRMKFLPPVPAPRNFRDYHAFEAHVRGMRAGLGMTSDMPAAWYDQPSFYFGNAGALVGHEHAVYGPAGSNQLDFELELGMIIGRGGRDIVGKDAWKHVAGFTIINDFSARDLQADEMSLGFGPGKGKDFATAVGPYLVTLDQMKDRIDDTGRLHLNMTAKINGKEVCRGNAASMHFTWPQIIEHASRDAELFPGDLIGSGAVGGGCILEIGVDTTGGWLKPGDTVELEIERLGILRTPIVDHPPTRAGNSVRRAHALT